MDRNLFRYIWRHSRRDQLVIFAVVIASLPFYFWSLELPKRIVNDAIQGRAFTDGKQTVGAFDVTLSLPGFLGGGSWQLFPGFQLDQMGLLFGLSGLFLALVLINGGFKYWINVAKGALGERMLRRMRFDLVRLLLRFLPQTLHGIKPAEAATIVKDEVEPIGGFIGDAFVLPLFLGTQAATAMAFILMQNLWLGLLAGSVVAIQLIVIPYLRREQLRLGKERQIASRKLAGRVGEIVEGIEVVHVHDASRWELAEIGGRLHHLFDLRFRLFKRKFMVKFLNNLLAQITPFLFYAIGGYLALKGQIDIGQLVAVIGAYRDLPPPLKELIDWDQQRMDVQLKYDQVLQQFLPDQLMAEELQDPARGRNEPLVGPLVVQDLRIMDQHGQVVLDHFTLDTSLPQHVALIGEGAAPSALARVIARRMEPAHGRLQLADLDLTRLPEAISGRRMAYAGPDPVLFPGSIRDNLVYGLRRCPREAALSDDPAYRRRLAEARATGNPVDDPETDWLDYAAAGATDPLSLDLALVAALELTGMGADVYRFGLSGRIDAGAGADLRERIVGARHRLRERLASEGMARLVEPFDPARYNAQATLGENILFGVPLSGPLRNGRLTADPDFGRALNETGLADLLVEIGLRIAQTMTEIFRGLPPGDPLFEEFSFIAADDLPDYGDMLRKVSLRGPSALTLPERLRVMAVPLDYIEPRHRLGLLDEAVMQVVLRARARFRDLARARGSVAFYDPVEVCEAAPLRDNLLFGRVAHGLADAEARITAAMTRLIEELGLREEVERLGLSYQVGPSGRLLTPAQRVRVHLARCLVKQPDIVILDGACTALGEREAERILRMLLDHLAGRTLIAVLRDDALGEHFDSVIEFDGAQARLVRVAQASHHQHFEEVQA